MSVNNYDDLRQHIGHKIECVCYGAEGEDPDNIAVECEDCSEALLDFDAPGDAELDSTVESYSEEALREKCGIWGEHPTFPWSDWTFEVSNNETRQGYWSYVESCVQNQLDEVRDMKLEELPVNINNEEFCPEARDLIKERIAKGE